MDDITFWVQQIIPFTPVLHKKKKKSEPRESQQLQKKSSFFFLNPAKEFQKLEKRIMVTNKNISSKFSCHSSNSDQKR